MYWLSNKSILVKKANKWLHTMLNVCFKGNKIPKIWRQSKIIAILKPGKDSAIPKNYRPISLLCHTYKLYERIILNRIAPVVLSPVLFNIYTNDQHLHNGTRSFIYTDDLCVTAQQPSFVEVETTIEESLIELTQYYRSNNLRANPDQTEH